jgi:1-aminocyclopropane-1-carboxylate deaminase
MLLEELIKNPSTPLQKVEDDFIGKSGITLYIKRLDLTHPQVSGNKWYKLKYNLIEAGKKGYDTLLTFGGAYSNHIHATAAAGTLFGFRTIGVIRGEVHLPLNPTLLFAKENGMELFYLDRVSYRDKYNKQLLTFLNERYGKFYLIPEGGSNSLAVQGCREIFEDINEQFDYICTACGTGGTLAGLISGLQENQRALGFSVLKGGDFLNSKVKNLLDVPVERDNRNWKIITDYHFGGYAKFTKELLQFITNFENRNNIKLEPIYSGKMIFGIYDLIRKSYFPEGSKIIALHNGGLQGLEGLRKKLNSWKM